MSELPHDFGSLAGAHDERPGPIETLVSQWIRAGQVQHASDGLELARRIDRAITASAAAITQSGPLVDDRLRKLVIVTHVGAIHELDRVVAFLEALSEHGLEELADCAWNFRNCAVPYKPDDALYLDHDQ